MNECTGMYECYCTFVKLICVLFAAHITRWMTTVTYPDADLT